MILPVVVSYYPALFQIVHMDLLAARPLKHHHPLQLKHHHPLQLKHPRPLQLQQPHPLQLKRPQVLSISWELFHDDIVCRFGMAGYDIRSSICDHCGVVDLEAQNMHHGSKKYFVTVQSKKIDC